MTDEARPAISVLLPMYNSMPYLPEAIDSIVGQTFGDWELVVVDNASTDGSDAYVLQRAETDPRIRLIRNETNIGISGSLNRGLDACRGEWVARIDGDDRALPKRLERQLAFVQANQDVVVLSCFAHYINPAGDRIARASHDLTSREAYQRAMATGEVIGILHPGALIRRETAIDAGGYRPEYEPAEDIDLWNRLSERGVVMVLPQYLMEYRLHNSSIVATQMDLGHRKREWAGDSMRARRDGQPEPTWEEAQQRWAKATVLERFDRRRRFLVDNLLRRGRQELAAGHQIAAYARFATAAALRPSYSAPRILRHLAPQRLASKLSPSSPLLQRKAGRA